MQREREREPWEVSRPGPFLMVRDASVQALGGERCPAASPDGEGRVEGSTAPGCSRMSWTAGRGQLLARSQSEARAPQPGMAISMRS